MRASTPLLLLVLGAVLAASPAVAAERKVRAIAIQSRIDVTSAESEPTFYREMARLMGQASRQFSPDRPNLVTFGEDFGVLTAMFGPAGEKARRATTLSGAVTGLAETHAAGFLTAKARAGFRLSDARATGIAVADDLYTPFVRIFGTLADRYDCYLVACTLTPEVAVPASGGTVMEAKDDNLYATAFFFGPDGTLIGRQHKVHPSHLERTAFDVVPSRIEDLVVWSTPFGKVGVALGGDALDLEVVHTLDRQGCEIMVAPGFNAAGSGWAVNEGRRWVPQAWLDATLGPLQPGAKAIQAVVNPMAVGRFFESVGDGQSAITRRGAQRPGRSYVGIDDDDLTGDARQSAYTGEFLGVAPWVVPDPTNWVDGGGARLVSRERRRYLRGVAGELADGGSMDGQAIEAIVAADLSLP